VKGLPTSHQTIWLISLIFLTACGNNSPQVIEKQPVNPQSALLASACTGCHAYEQNAEGDAAAFLKILQDIKSAEGYSSMHRMIRGYSDEELKLISNYFGSEK